MSKSKKSGKGKGASRPTAIRLRTKAVASTAAAPASAAAAPPPKTIVISANELRALAEAADGTRQIRMCLVENNDPEHPEHPVKVEKGAGATTVLIEVQTDENQKFTTQAELSTKPVLDTYKDENGKVKTINMKDCDAVFTSLSAVEKFLVPYYAKMKTLDEVKTMRDNFAGSDVTVAAFHLPSSYEGLAYAGGVVFAKEADKKDKLQGMSFEQFIALK